MSKFLCCILCCNKLVFGLSMYVICNTLEKEESMNYRSLVAIHGIPVRHEVFVQPVHLLHLSLINAKASDIAVLDDALLRHALRKGDKVVL